MFDIKQVVDWLCDMDTAHKEEVAVLKKQIKQLKAEYKDLQPECNCPVCNERYSGCSCHYGVGAGEKHMEEVKQAIELRGYY